jgi:hypothetical protein
MIILKNNNMKFIIMLTNNNKINLWKYEKIIIIKTN